VLIILPVYVVIFTIGIVLLGASGIMLFEDSMNTYGKQLRQSEFRNLNDGMITGRKASSK